MPEEPLIVHSLTYPTTHIKMSHKFVSNSWANHWSSSFMLPKMALSIQSFILSSQLISGRNTCHLPLCQLLMQLMFFGQRAWPLWGCQNLTSLKWRGRWVLSTPITSFIIQCSLHCQPLSRLWLVPGALWGVVCVPRWAPCGQPGQLTTLKLAVTSLSQSSVLRTRNSNLGRTRHGKHSMHLLCNPFAAVKDILSFLLLIAQPKNLLCSCCIRHKRFHNYQ